jgi:hypothetical protein
VDGPWPKPAAKKKDSPSIPVPFFCALVGSRMDGAGVAAGDHGTKSSDHFGERVGQVLVLPLAFHCQPKPMPSTTKPPLFSPLIQVICAFVILPFKKKTQRLLNILNAVIVL